MFICSLIEFYQLKRKVCIHINLRNILIITINIYLYFYNYELRTLAFQNYKQLYMHILILLNTSYLM